MIDSRRLAEIEELLGAKRVAGVDNWASLMSEALAKFPDNEEWQATGTVGIAIKPNGSCLYQKDSASTFGPQFFLHRIDRKIGICVPRRGPIGTGPYTVYMHHLGTGFTKQHYIGITRRDWSSRWFEHLSAARGGSEYLFHRALRSALAQSWELTHVVIASGLTYEEAMVFEEGAVALCSLYPLGTNMVPGGGGWYSISRSPWIQEYHREAVGTSRRVNQAVRAEMRARG